MKETQDPYRGNKQRSLFVRFGRHFFRRDCIVAIKNRGPSPHDRACDCWDVYLAFGNSTATVYATIPTKDIEGYFSEMKA